MTALDEKPAEAPPVSDGLPDGFQVQIDLRCAKAGDFRYLVGGSPTRLLRMSDTALGMTSEDGRIEVCDNVTRRLARALLDAGIANPRPMFGPQPQDVTVVVPVRDNQVGIDRLLDALDGLNKHGRAGLPPEQRQPSLEAQVVDAADALAYTAHDLDDGLRSGLLHPEDLLELPLWRELQGRSGVTSAGARRSYAS